MSTRKVKDAKDLDTNELIYFKSHAKATYMSNGKSIEDALNDGDFTQKLVFENVTANWYSDSWYIDYPYVSNITVDGILSTDYAEVIFDPKHAASGNYAPVCETADGSIYIFSKTADPIQIPTIIIFR